MKHLLHSVYLPKVMYTIPTLPSIQMLSGQIIGSDLPVVAGSKYELPKLVLSDPANLVSERDSKQHHAQQVELVARRI